MKLAISTIAWEPSVDSIAIPAVRNAGAEGIEITPARLGQPPESISLRDAEAMARVLKEKGLPISSMQSLLAGTTDLLLFGDAGSRIALKKRLKQMVTLASGLGCGPVVFGSPGSRIKGALNFEKALKVAVSVLREPIELAGKSGVTFCIEANAVAYGCDFVTRLADAALLVRAIDHPAAAIVADSGNMEMAGETLADLVAVIDLVRHVHLSHALLAAIDEKSVFARRVLDFLLDREYSGIITIEMKPHGALGGCDAACRAVEVISRWMGR